ncbi:MAG: hypothetical protein ACUVTZ_08565 [Armatimonadota bacterium]
MGVAANMWVDVYEYTDVQGNPLPTGDPFDPYANWWTRRRADVPCYGEVLCGQLRDFIFGDREGEFWRLFLDRGLLEVLGRSDREFARRWLVRKPAVSQNDEAVSWLVDFAPYVYDGPLEHIEAYVKVLDPEPWNRD